MLAFRRVLLQADWNEAIKAADKQVWLSLRQNSSTQDCKLEINESGETRCTDPDITARLVESNRLHVVKASEQISCDFFAPCETLNVHKKSVIALDVNKDSLGVSASTDGQLLLWQSENGLKRRNFEGHLADVYCCRFFPSGCVVLSGGADMMLKIWNTENGQCVQTISGHTRAINDLGFVENGRNVLSCSKDGSCKLWDCGSAKCLATFGQSGSSPVNAICMTGGPLSTEGWSGDSLNSDTLEHGTAGKIVTLAYERDELASYALDSRNKINGVKLNSAVNCVAGSNEHKIACGLQDGTFMLFDSRKFEDPLSTWYDDRPAVLSITPYRAGFFVSFGDGSVCYLHDEPTRNKNCTHIELTGPDLEPVYKIAINNRYLFTSCRDSKIRKYELSSLNDQLEKIIP